MAEQTHSTLAQVAPNSQAAPERPPRNPSRPNSVSDDDLWKDVNNLCLEAVVYTDEPASTGGEELKESAPTCQATATSDADPKPASFRKSTIRRKPVPRFEGMDGTVTASAPERKLSKENPGICPEADGSEAARDAMSTEQSSGPGDTESKPSSSRKSTIRRKPVPHFDDLADLVAEHERKKSLEASTCPAPDTTATTPRTCVFTCPHSGTNSALTPLPNQGRDVGAPAPPLMTGPAFAERAGSTAVHIAVRTPAGSDAAPAAPCARSWALAWFLRDGPAEFARGAAAMRVLRLQDNLCAYTYAGPAGALLGEGGEDGGHALVAVGTLSRAQRVQLEQVAETIPVMGLECGGMPDPQVWSSQHWVTELLRAGVAHGLFEDAAVEDAISKARQVAGYDAHLQRKKASMNLGGSIKWRA